MEIRNIAEIKANPKGHVKACVICNSDFKTKPSHYERRQTCSMKCRGELLKKNQAGVNHPQYKDGKAMKHPYTCRLCGEIFHSDKGYDGREPSYCSKQCAGKGLKKERPVKNCDYCKNDFQVKYLQGDHKYCSIKCSGIANGLKISGVKRPHLSGQNSPAWRGGVTAPNEAARKSLDYRLWRTSVFTRDNFTCQLCGQKGGKLNADHIKPFAHFPHLRFDIDNGQTLCIDCHKQTDTYGSKAIKYGRQS